MSRYGNDKVKHNFYRKRQTAEIGHLVSAFSHFFHLKWKYIYKLWTGFSVIITTKLIYRYRYICRSVSINDVRPIMHLCLPLVSASKKGHCVEYLAYNSTYFNVRARTDARTKYRIFVYKCAESANCHGVEGRHAQFVPRTTTNLSNQGYFAHYRDLSI